MTWLVCPCWSSTQEQPSQGRARPDKTRHKPSQDSAEVAVPPLPHPLQTTRNFCSLKEEKKPKKKINKIKLIFFLVGFVNVLEEYGELISSADWNNRKWQLLTRLCPTWRVEGGERDRRSIEFIVSIMFSICADKQSREKCKKALSYK